MICSSNLGSLGTIARHEIFKYMHKMVTFMQSLVSYMITVITQTRMILE